MVKALGIAAAFVMLGTSYSTPAFALGFDAAIEQCALVAAEEQNAVGQEDNPYRGFCISATSEYLTTLAGSGLAPDVLGTELATYVVRLTELLNDRICRPDSEIPQAIAVTSDASRDPEQAEQIRLIALTLFDCDFITTASIGADASNFSSSGNPSFSAPPSNNPPTNEPPVTPPGGEVPGYEDGPGTPASQT